MLSYMLYSEGCWLVADSGSRIEGAPVAIVEQLFVPFHRLGGRVSGFHWDCRINFNPVFRQFTRAADNAGPYTDSPETRLS